MCTRKKDVEKLSCGFEGVILLFLNNLSYQSNVWFCALFSYNWAGHKFFNLYLDFCLVTLHVFHYGNFLHEHQDVQDVWQIQYYWGSCKSWVIFYIINVMTLVTLCGAGLSRMRQNLRLSIRFAANQRIYAWCSGHPNLRQGKDLRRARTSRCWSSRRRRLRWHRPDRFHAFDCRKYYILSDKIPSIIA